MVDKRLEKPIYINIKICYEDMAEALEVAKAKMGTKVNTQLVLQLIWNKAKDIS